jgi:hypothetical protein
MKQLTEHYLEDFAVGQTFGSGRFRIDGQRGKSAHLFELTTVIAREKANGAEIASDNCRHSRNMHLRRAGSSSEVRVEFP